MVQKLIRITADGGITLEDFPCGSRWREELNRMVGPDCRLAECVWPRRLYRELHVPHVQTAKTGLCMIVDEDGIRKNLPLNVAGSWLYETDKHHAPILGNILIVGECRQQDGCTDLCGIPDNLLREVYPALARIAAAVRNAKKVSPNVQNDAHGSKKVKK